MVLVPMIAAAALLGDDMGGCCWPSSPRRTCRRRCARSSYSGARGGRRPLPIPVTALFTQGLYRAMALLTVPVLAVYVALSAAAATTDSLYWLAAAMPVAWLGFSLCLLALLYGPGFLRIAGHLGWEAVRLGVPAAACFAAPRRCCTTGSAAGDAAAFVLGLILYGALVAWFMPAYRSLAVRLAACGSPLAARS